MEAFFNWLREALVNCLPLDYTILDFIQEHMSGPVQDFFWSIVTLFGEAGIFWIVLAVLLLCFRKTRKTGASMALALLMGVLICNVWLKNEVARCRPFLDIMADKHDASKVVDGWFQLYHNGTAFPEWIADIRANRAVLFAADWAKAAGAWVSNLIHFGAPNELGLLVPAPADFCFPSGHTIASFEACTAIFCRNRVAGVFAAILACMIAYSRMYLYVHYPSDVLTALVLGVIVALVASLIISIIWHFLPSRSAGHDDDDGEAFPRRSSGKAGRFLAK